jgi:hypothetical protein
MKSFWLLGGDLRSTALGSISRRATRDVVLLAEPCSPVRIKIGYGPNGRRAAVNHATRSGKSALHRDRLVRIAIDEQSGVWPAVDGSLRVPSPDSERLRVATSIRQPSQDPTDSIRVHHANLPGFVIISVPEPQQGFLKRNRPRSENNSRAAGHGSGPAPVTQRAGAARGMVSCSGCPWLSSLWGTERGPAGGSASHREKRANGNRK